MKKKKLIKDIREGADIMISSMKTLHLKPGLEFYDEEQLEEVLNKLNDMLKNDLLDFMMFLASLYKKPIIKSRKIVIDASNKEDAEKQINDLDIPDDVKKIVLDKLNKVD